MTKRIAVVGAGIVGAAIAHRLAKSGAEVVVVDRDGPGAGASGKSFGWLNANDVEPVFYNAFRQEALRAWRRVEAEVDLPIDWNGCLSWEHPAQELSEQAAVLDAAGHPARMLDAAGIARLEPALAAPPTPAFFASAEGAVDPAVSARLLLDAAKSLGAVMRFQTEATTLLSSGGAVSGLQTTTGEIRADAVVLAAGLGAPPLAATAGVALPVEAKPGLIVRTTRAAPLIRAVLAAPGLEIRQERDGAFLIATAPHSVAESGPNDEAAASALALLRSLIPAAQDVEIAEAAIGNRPVPVDGLPILGAPAPGLAVAVMHSGATLAPLVGEIMAERIAADSGDIPPELDIARFS